MKKEELGELIIASEDMMYHVAKRFCTVMRTAQMRSRRRS